MLFWYRVEIKTPVCLIVGRNNAHSCAGYIVLRADEADFHENSGQIEGRGNVPVTREKWVSLPIAIFGAIHNVRIAAIRPDHGPLGDTTRGSFQRLPLRSLL